MSRQRDAVIEARLDSRDLATCAKYLIELNTPISSNSELLWYITQLAIYAIGDKQDRFESTSDARAYLASIGLTNVNRSGRNKMALHSALQTENLKADGFDPAYLSRKSKMEEIGKGKWNKMLQEALNKVETLVDKDGIDGV